MTTLKTLRDRIIFETDRENDETITEDRIDEMIKRSIRFYGKRRFEFNEQSKTVTTTADNQYLDAPVGLLQDDLVQVTIGGHEYPLGKHSHITIADWHGASNTKGQPTDYCWQNGQFRIWPIPNQAYDIHVLGLYAEPDLNADDDANAWTDQGQDLICHRVKYLLGRDVLFDDEMMRNAAIATSEALSDLYFESAVLQRTGRVQAHI